MTERFITPEQQAEAEREIRLLLTGSRRKRSTYVSPDKASADYEYLLDRQRVRQAEYRARIAADPARAAQVRAHNAARMRLKRTEQREKARRAEELRAAREAGSISAIELAHPELYQPIAPGSSEGAVSVDED